MHASKRELHRPFDLLNSVLLVYLVFATAIWHLLMIRYDFDCKGFGLSLIQREIWEHVEGAIMNGGYGHHLALQVSGLPV